MFGSEILEIAVGLAFIYLLLSLVVTAVTEMFSRLRALRAKNLYMGIQNLIGEFYPEGPADSQGKVPPGELGKTKNADDFFDTPIIKSLTQPLKPKFGRIYKLLAGRPRPGYITSKRFFQGLVQTFGESDHKIETIADIQKMIDRLPNGDLKQNLNTILKSAGDKVEKFEVGVRDWFNDSMDRVSGWYKRQAHTITLVVSFVVTMVFNASTINVAEILWTDDARRSAVTELAINSVSEGFGADTKAEGPAIGGTDPVAPNGKGEKGNGVPEVPVVSEPDAIDQGRMAAEIISESSALPLGWKGENPFNRNKISPLSKMKIPGWDWSDWISHLLGWSLTAFALTLGAPFWFDTLTKVVNLRTTGVSPDESAKKKSAS